MNKKVQIISKLTVKIMALVAVVFSLQTSMATDAKAEGYLGGLVGYGSGLGTGPNLDGGLVLGGTLGYRLMPELGVAFTYQHAALETKVGGIDAAASQYMAEANFFTVFFLSGGLHAGVVNTKLGPVSSDDFGAGAHLGIDVKLAENVSVGVQAYYTYVTQENDKHSLLNFTVPVKVWF